MRLVQTILVFTFLLASAQAFAHHDGGACASYFATCKDDQTVKDAAANGKKAKWQAMEACVTKAANADTDTAKGKKCTDAQAAHKQHMKQSSEGSSGAGAAPSGQ